MIINIVEKALNATLDDFSEARNYGQDGLWNERTFQAYFFHNLMTYSDIKVGLVETRFRIKGKDVIPDLNVVIARNGESKRCIFEFKFYAKTTEIRNDWEKVMKYGSAKFDYGFLIAITSQDISDIPDKKIINEYTAMSFIKIGKKLRMAPDSILALKILEELSNLTCYQTINNLDIAATLMQDYSFLVYFPEDNMRFALDLLFNFEKGTTKFRRIESKLRKEGFQKLVDENNQSDKTYTNRLTLGEFKLEKGVDIFKTEGFREAKNIIERIKPILKGMKPTLN